MIFCSDFDNSNSPPWEWTDILTVGNGIEGVDTTNYLSAPNGFLASNGSLEWINSGVETYLDEPFASTAGHIDYSLNAYLSTYDTTNNPPLPIAELVLSPSTAPTFSLQLLLRQGNLYLIQITLGTDGGVADNSHLGRSDRNADLGRN